MYNDLSDDILKIIFDYIEPSLNMLVLNKKSNKKILPLLRYTFDYYEQIRQIEYLKYMRIKPTYYTLNHYFPYKEMNPPLTLCEGYTIKGLPCSRKCKNRFCFQHEDTMKSYRKTNFYKKLLSDIGTIQYY